MVDETAGHQKPKDDKMDIKLGQTYKHTCPMRGAVSTLTITRIFEDGTFQGVTECGDRRTCDSNASDYMEAV